MSNEDFSLDIFSPRLRAKRPVDEAKLANDKVKVKAKSPKQIIEAFGMDDQVESLKKDMRDSFFNEYTMSKPEIRAMVATYYQMQDNRMRSHNRMRALVSEDRPSKAIEYATAQNAMMESNVQSILQKAVTESGEIGKWLLSIYGIGPVIAAAILSHIDISKVVVAGQIFSYAGLNPGQRRERGKKLEFNPDLKTALWKAGQSFVMMGKDPRNYYRDVYDKRKVYEAANNANGVYAEQAAKILEERDITAAEYKATLEKGMLSDGHIDARCKRYAAKMFISHYFELHYFVHHGKLPPRPYVIEHMGHVEYVRPPNSHLITGFDEALEKDDRDIIPATYRERQHFGN